MWPPSLAWYSSDSAQQTFSGSQRGTVIASAATGFEHPDEFGDRPVVLGHVLEDLRGDDAVESAVGVGQVQRIALDRLALRRCGRLALLLHRLQDLVDVVEIGDVLVEADDIGAAPVCLEGVPARAAADVDHLRAGTDTEPVEVDGQHFATRSQARSYTATVCAATDSQLNTSSARRRPFVAEAAQFQRRVEQFAEHRWSARRRRPA